MRQSSMKLQSDDTGNVPEEASAYYPSRVFPRARSARRQLLKMSLRSIQQVPKVNKEKRTAGDLKKRSATWY